MKALTTVKGVIELRANLISTFSYHDDDEYSDEESETMPALPHSPNARQGLEWDEEASLQTSTNVSRTYRV